MTGKTIISASTDPQPMTKTVNDRDLQKISKSMMRVWQTNSVEDEDKENSMDSSTSSSIGKSKTRPLSLDSSMTTTTSAKPIDISKQHRPRTFYEEFKASLPKSTQTRRENSSSASASSSKKPHPLDSTEILASAASMDHAVEGLSDSGDSNGINCGGGGGSEGECSVTRQYNECIVKLKTNSQKEKSITTELQLIQQQIDQLTTKRDRLNARLEVLLDEREYLEETVEDLIMKLNRVGTDDEDEDDNSIYNPEFTEDYNNNNSSSSSSLQYFMKSMKTNRSSFVSTLSNTINADPIGNISDGIGEFRTLIGHKSSVLCLDLVDAHDIMVSGGADGNLRAWDMATGRAEFSIQQAHQTAINCLQYDGALAATGGMDKKIHLWNIGSISGGDFAMPKDPLSTLLGHFGGVNALQFHQSLLISGGQDGKIKMWDLHSGTCTHTFHTLPNDHDLIIHSDHHPQSTHRSSMATSSSSPSQPENNSTLSSTAEHRPGRNQQARKGMGLAPLASVYSENVEGVTCLQFYQYAMATGSQDGIIRLWDTRMKSTSNSGSFHSDSVSTSSSIVGPRETSSSACKRQLTGHTLPVTCLQFDDYNLISGSLDKSIRIWDLRMGKVVEGFMSPSINGISALQFDRRRVVAAAGDSSVTIFDRETHRQTQLEGHAGTVRCLKYLEGRRIVTGSEDASIKVWNI